MFIEPQAPVVSKASRVIVLSAFTVMSAGSLGALTWSLFVPALISGTPPSTWNWGTLWLLGGGLVGIISWLGSGICRRFGTNLSPAGVSTLSLRGRLLLPWAEVHRVKVEGHEIYLYGQKVSAVINVFCYTEPNRVGSYVSSRLPHHVRG